MVDVVEEGRMEDCPSEALWPERMRGVGGGPDLEAALRLGPIYLFSSARSSFFIAGPRADVADRDPCYSSSANFPQQKSSNAPLP